MAFAWVDYLDLAARLAPDSREAEKRTAISRAYYAAFNQADSCLRLHGISPTPGEIHKKVWDEFKRGSHAARQISLDGDRLRRSRVDADYKVPFPRDVAFETGVSVQLARKLSTAIGTLRRSDFQAP